ncbi:hypothetical protein [Sandaracinus amylolyticus]|uniref:Uncharacterized protein n=1 Tax=Sandaracinus amylolyticus TaxID=927083 RepID=A0A0F6SGM3_9BACT|nr:hypothetical protein [Sandaracinus amylolyticus]AKF08944.1 hypothetical protein DB32_006093 [Sandaracinus amylolyticus]
MAYKDFLIDKRILQRNIDKGLVDAKQYDKLLTSLPDRADNAATAAVEDELTDVDDIDEGEDDEDEEG